jgi:hypothetical protein
MAVSYYFDIILAD